MPHGGKAYRKSASSRMEAPVYPDEKTMDLVNELVKAGRRFDARGWVLGTSGNFSAVMSRDPLRLAITRSGTHKGELTAGDILEFGDGRVLSGHGAASAETL